MNRLIDNAYLQAIGACCQKQATSEHQVETFARFIGEILVAEKFVFTGDPKGPVLPVTLSSLKTIRPMLEKALPFQHVVFDGETFEAVCSDARAHLIQELRFLTTGNLQPLPKGAYPRFLSGSNPHEKLHQILSEPRVSWSKKLSFGEKVFGDVSSANLAANILLNSELIESIGSRFTSADWTLDHSLQLTLAARMAAYDSFAKRLSGTYLPSSGRAKAHRLMESSPPISLLSFAGEDSGEVDQEEMNTLPKLISAIVISSKGHPGKIIETSLAIRRETRDLRKELCSLQGSGDDDACLIEVRRLHTGYNDVIHDLVKGVRPPSFFATLQPGLVLLGLPTISIDMEKFGSWVDFKRKERKVRRLATVILDAESRDSVDPVELLKQKALVK